MKRLANLPALLVVLSAWNLQAQTQGPVQTHMLDEMEVRTIRVARTRVTTVLFPSPIEANSAVNVTTGLTNMAGFQLDYRPGSAFFSLRALQPKASANLNVLWNGRTFAFEIEESPNPALSVVMQLPPTAAAWHARQLPVTPTRLVGLIQKARAYPLLARSHPQAVAGVTLARPRRVVDYADVQVETVEIYRFDPEDTLVFFVLLRSKSAQPVLYESFSVRVGDRLYSQSVSDASGRLSLGEEQAAWFAITGSPNGARNLLSLKNDFKVLLNRP